MIQQWLMCGSMCAVYISVEHSLEPKGSPVVFDSIITGPAEKIIWFEPKTFVTHLGQCTIAAATAFH